MTDVIVIPSKKLKQARLSFGKLPQNAKGDENKENYPKKFSNNNDARKSLGSIEDNHNSKEVAFKSMSRKKNKENCQESNTIEVKADVHQTIQCPEVSTSSIHSDSDTDNIEDLTHLKDDNVKTHSKDCLETSKITQELNNSIDDAIEAVVLRAQTDGENMITNRDAIRESKKRRRVCHKPSDVNTEDFSEGNKHISTVPVIVVDSPQNNEQKHKNPRKSIVDMLSVSKCESSATPVETHHDISQDKDGIIVIDEDSMDVESSPTSIESCKSDTAKKRRRSKSPIPKPTDNNESLNSVENQKSHTSESEDAAIIKSVSEQLAKKPRRSVCPDTDISCSTLNDSESNAKQEEVVDLCKNETDDIDMITPIKSNKPDTNVISKVSPTTKTSPPSASKPRSARKLNSEAQRLKEEKDKEREEKRKQREEEKHAREMEKLEVKRKKEEERLQREEEKRKKREEVERLKEERLKKKQEEIEKKKEELETKRLEKERKDEEKRKEKELRESEKRVKEEEKMKFLQEKTKAEEEKKRITNKQASTFKNFFTSPTRSTPVKKVPQKLVGSFIPFQLKEDMFLPPNRQPLNSSALSALDCMMNGQGRSHTYFKEIKSNENRRSSRTIPKRKHKLLSLSDDGLEVIAAGDPSQSLAIKAKLLQFSENNRPPYYGTWRKRSKSLNPKMPFKKDTDLLDYEIDSDDEWEDPGEGEDIANSDGEDEGDKDDDEDEGDGFFVPHGYLSDDEGINEEGEDEVPEELSDQKLKLKQQEFENSFKQKVKVMTPVTIGCVWEDTKDKFPAGHVAILQKYEVQFFIPFPIDLDEKPVKSVEESVKSEMNKSSTKRSVPEEAIPDMVHLLHGNPHSTARLIAEFQAYWQKKNTEGIPDGYGPPKGKTGLDNESVKCNPKVIPPSQQSPSCSPMTSLLPHSPNSSCKSSPVAPSPSGVTGLTVSLMPPEKGPHWISKLQLSRKIKEIGVYGRKENLTRACWFVLDSVFEKYSLSQSDFPVPCKWKYLTFEPDLKIYPTEIITQSCATPLGGSSETPTRLSINKFATTKLTAEDLLEKSNLRLKMDKEKQVAQTPVEKFATAKITPDQLLEISRQKLEQDSQKRPANFTPSSNNCGNQIVDDDTLNDLDNSTSPVASFGVPSHAAFKSFFKINQPSPQKCASAEIPKLVDVTKVAEVRSGSELSLENSCTKLDQNTRLEVMDVENLQDTIADVKPGPSKMDEDVKMATD